MINVFLAISLLFSVSCKSTAEKSAAEINPNGKTTISGSVTACNADSMIFYGLDGIMLQKMMTTPIAYENGQGSFSIDVGELDPGFYFIGPTPNSVRIMAINHDPVVQLSGTCSEFRGAQIVEGKTSKEFEQVTREIEGTLQAFNRNIQTYRTTMQRGGDLTNVTDNMIALDNRKIAFIDSLKKANPFMAKYAGIRTYISYQHYEKNAEQMLYNNEPEYFANNYFQFVDLSDPALNNMPHLHDAFKSYAGTLTQLGFSAEGQKDLALAQISQIPSGSSAYKLAILGLTEGFKGKNMMAYVSLADEYIKAFPGENNQIVNAMKKEAAGARTRISGAMAPEINLPTPEGENLKLSDLRGKVVLIDFWASWCGPCRRENPNVVRVYEKYKDQGFEILSVSLDRDKARWLKAIEDDGLEWLHVSDLKFWQSEAAKTYGVGSIPYTVLVDREGKIIASRLRGAALENKLAEIFGT